MSTAIAVGVDRTTALKDLNEFELRLRGRLLVQSDCELAGSPAVRGRSGEGQLLRIADFHIVHCGNVIDTRALLAWVVTRPSIV